MTPTDHIVAAAVTSASKSVVKSLVESAGQDRADLREAAKDTSEMKHAGRLVGQKKAIQQRALITAMSPLKWIHLVPDEYFRENFLDELGEKMKDIPEEQIQTPKASIAGRAMEGLAYSLDEPGLKEMYLNLLAGAANSAKAPKVHPSFVGIIQALSVQEVPVLEVVLTHRSMAAIRLQDRSLSDGSFQIVQTCVLNLVDSSSGIPLGVPDLPMWVDNWQRLGLVDLTFTEWLSNPEVADLYDWAKRSPEYNAIALKIHEAGLSTEREAAYDRGMIRATPLGLRFHEIVSQPN